MDRNYDYQRAAGLLAYAWARNNQDERAATLFEQVTQTSTLSETQFNYAQLLAAREKQRKRDSGRNVSWARRPRCRATQAP